MFSIQYFKYPYQLVGVYFIKTTQMKNYKNKVQLIGIIDNPEFIIHDNGFKHTKFRIITNETYIATDGVKSSDKMYHLCYAFGKQFDILERFINHGAEIAVEGTIINKSHISGNLEYEETSIHVSDLLILNNKR